MKLSADLHVIQDLTAKQKRIVNDITFPNYIKAGAGTGKTEVIVQKILKILENKEVSLDQFAIITFTNKATNEMKKRLIDRLYLKYLKTYDGKNLRKQLERTNILDISTIHSFCESIIRKYGMNINIPNNFTISSFKYEIDEIITDVLDKYADNPIFENIQLYKIRDFVKRLYNENENRGIVLPSTVQDLLYITRHNEYWDSFKRIFIDIYLKSYNAIEKKKKEDNILTQNDLIKYAARLLNIEFVARSVSQKYKYLFIDEFQDTSIDQFNLVKAFMANGVNVFVVGDEKQSIYKFRGSDISSFYKMTDVISEIKSRIDSSSEIFINENFRTDYELLTHINTIFNSKFRFGDSYIPFKNLPLDKIDKYKKVVKVTERPLQIKYKKKLSDIVFDLINNQKLKNEPIKYKDIAILCRRNSDLDIHAAELKSKGIPVEVVGGKGFYRASEIIDTYKILNALINKGTLEVEELKYTDYYKACLSANINFESLLTEMSVTVRENVISSFLNILYKKSKINKYYKSFCNLQAIANLQKLQTIARDKMNSEGLQPVDFLHYLHLMISTNQEEDEAELSRKDKENGAVSLYSIHKAKGLAFNIVIIPDIELNLNRAATFPKIISQLDNNYKIAFNSYQLFNDEALKRFSDPDYNILLSGYTCESLEEEIRIFYVAMTRARHMIILSSNESKDSLIYHIKNENYYVSVYRWLFEISNSFINTFEEE